MHIPHTAEVILQVQDQQIPVIPLRKRRTIGQMPGRRTTSCAPPPTRRCQPPHAWNDLDERRLLVTARKMTRRTAASMSRSLRKIGGRSWSRNGRCSRPRGRCRPTGERVLARPAAPLLADLALEERQLDHLTLEDVRVELGNLHITSFEGGMQLVGDGGRDDT